MPLPRKWVEQIHARLLVRYGSPWLSLYKDIDPELVIADWAGALNGFGGAAITHALEHLPDDSPPNAAQFSKMCMRGPQSQAPALPWPEPDPAVAVRVLQSINRVARHEDPLAWACRLKDREENHGGKLTNGLGMTAAHRTMWRAAIANGQADAQP